MCFLDSRAEVVEYLRSRNKSEIDSDGVVHKAIFDIKDLRKSQDVTTVEERTKITFKFNNDKIDKLNDVDKSYEDLKSTKVEVKNENTSSNSMNEKLEAKTTWWQFWKK